MQKHILIVDDDELMRRSLSFNLKQNGYRTSTASNAEAALTQARRDPPDLVLLDIGLPGMDGLDALRQFKESFNLPVVFLTARRRNLDEVLGLELGADDYITKPFDQSVLLARIKTVFRRSSSTVLEDAKNEIVEAGDLRIDPQTFTAMINGKPLSLAPREFNLLHTLALHPGIVLSTQDLLEQVWGVEFIGQPQVVYVHIRWLREKIEEDPNHPSRILTVRGVGYKLIPRDA